MLSAHEIVAFVGTATPSRAKDFYYAGLEQDELGIWSAPSGARVVWFEDPDGNTLSLTEFEQAPTRRRSTKRPARKSSKRRGRRT